MTSTQIIDQQEDFRALETTEVEHVAGGALWSPVDVSEMPDRSVMCGTMWYLDQLLKKFNPRA
jgi:hypothetical protein